MTGGRQVTDVASGDRACAAIARHCAGNDLFQFAGHIGPHHPDRLRRRGHHGVHDRKDVGPVEHGAARQHLPRDHAERPEVAARVHILTGRLFRRHVPCRADRAARAGQPRHRLGVR